MDAEADVKTEDAFVDKDLDAALDSFDNLFCRRCFVSVNFHCHILKPSIMISVLTAFLFILTFFEAHPPKGLL